MSRFSFWRKFWSSLWMPGMMFLLGFLDAASVRGASGTDADINIVRAGGGGSIPVSVTGSTPDLDGLMKKCFSLHGAFTLVGSGAQYAIRFEAVGTTGVRVTVEPKIAGGIKVAPHEETGANWWDAAYRAGDDVVKDLTNLPGFFAGRLAFVSKRTGATEIYLSDLLGRQFTPLTADKADARYPHWSPDGTKIIYTGYYKTGFPDLVLIDLSGLPAVKKRTFASFTGTNTGGVFSPDGRRVAMILSSSGNAELYTSDVDGRNIVRVTKSRGLESSPTWAPDGSRLAVSSDPDGKPLLYTVSAAAGSTLNAIRTNVSNYCAEPSWNPRNDKQIAFMAAAGAGFEIEVFDFTTGKTTSFVSGSQPCWTNDGRHLIYTTGTNPEQLAVLDTKTGRSTTITTKGASQASFVYTK
jgi:TolB protein